MHYVCPSVSVLTVCCRMCLCSRHGQHLRCPAHQHPSRSSPGSPGTGPMHAPVSAVKAKICRPTPVLLPAWTESATDSHAGGAQGSAGAVSVTVLGNEWDLLHSLWGSLGSLLRGGGGMGGRREGCKSGRFVLCLSGSFWTLSRGPKCIYSFEPSELK